MNKATKQKAPMGVLTATARDRAGKGVARALRREGKVPAVLYSKGKQPMSLALPLKEVTMEYTRGRFRSRLIDIKLDSGTIKALPKDVQFHPVTDVIEHVDFIRIEPGVPVRVMVPVKFLGADKSVGVKRGGVLNIVRHEVEFTCAPESIPTHIEANVEALDIGGSVHINDISLPKGIEAVIKRNFTVATIAGRSSSMEEVKVETTVAAGAVPATEAAAEGAEAAAGATPAAGAAAPVADAKKDEGKKEGGKK